MATKEEAERVPRPPRQAKRSIAEASRAEDSEEEDFSDEEGEVELGEGLFETGQIIKVSVQEFMCHRKFTGEGLFSLLPSQLTLAISRLR